MRASVLLLEVRPSWWSYFWYLIFFWLIIPLVIAIWQRYRFAFRVYDDHIEIQRGVLTKYNRDIFLTEIRAVVTQQNFWQRMVNVGDVLIETEGSSNDDNTAPNLPDPMRIEEMVNRQKIRLEETRRA